jgi:hypothetical protein
MDIQPDADLIRKPGLVEVGEPNQRIWIYLLYGLPRYLSAET